MEDALVALHIRIQTVNRIYSKLQIEGDTRTKRKQLLKLLGMARN